MKNQWYAIGFDLDREQMRTFALPRMRKVKMTATRFERPADFSINAHLSHSFGVISGRREVLRGAPPLRRLGRPDGDGAPMAPLAADQGIAGR